MSNLTPSFRKIHSISSDAAHSSVRQAIRDNDKSITDLNQAIVKLKSSISATSSSSTSTTSTSTSTSTGASETVSTSSWNGLGTVNDESSETSYTMQQSDDGALLIFSDALPVAVVLNSSLTAPWFCFVQNWGSGVVTFTPSSGTIYSIDRLNSASMTLKKGYQCMIVLSSGNFYATTLPIVPLGFSAIAHEFLTAYDSTTGAFSAAQPAFTDIAGIAGYTQLPIATDSTIGAVKVDGTTITITGDGTISSSAGTYGSILTVSSTVGGDFTVPHGLGLIPAEVIILMTSSGSIWQAGNPDATNLYLAASDGGVTAKVYVYSTVNTPVGVIAAKLNAAPVVGGDFQIAHGLSSTPSGILILSTSGGAIWARSPAVDATYVYLSASDGGVTATIYVVA